MWVWCWGLLDAAPFPLHKSPCSAFKCVGFHLSIPNVVLTKKPPLHHHFSLFLPPFLFKAGGKYGPTVARGTYVAGEAMDVEVKLTAWHGGWFEFRLCVPVRVALYISLKYFLLFFFFFFFFSLLLSSQHISIKIQRIA